MHRKSSKNQTCNTHTQSNNIYRWKEAKHTHTRPKQKLIPFVFFFLRLFMHLSQQNHCILHSIIFWAIVIWLWCWKCIVVEKKSEGLNVFALLLNFRLFSVSLCFWKIHIAHKICWFRWYKPLNLTLKIVSHVQCNCVCWNAQF